jgi:DNA-binding response OmpR family regulator
MARSTPTARILVVEDDRKTADLIALYLRHAGHAVFVEHDGSQARRRIEQESFDLLDLDVMLPGTSGLELCVHAREATGAAVILLTARTSEEQRIDGLELGADDYVCKPFNPRELVARVNAVLRRAPPGGDDILRCGALALDRGAHNATLDGRNISLTRSEFAILEALMERPGRVRRRAELLARIAEGPDQPLDRTVDVHIRNLRRKLEPDPSAPRRLETVIGVGYRIALPAADGGSP